MKAVCHRTVVFRIHQLCSNIVVLFDQLVLLAQGKLVYSGEMSLTIYFSGMGDGYASRRRVR
jgi:ABC-type multidrug transport system ATPase subunit